MKIRISGNSIRFRLKQSEVKQFKEQGEIRETICFGSEAADQLSFVLKAVPSDSFDLSFQSNNIVVQVPQSTGDEWTNTELVGFEEMVDTGRGEQINILVEKDFKCLDGNDIEDADAYPNPNMHC